MSDWRNPGFGGEGRPAAPAAPSGSESQSNKGSSAAPGNTSEAKKGFLVPQVKDGLKLVGWIAGLILIAGLCWFLTQPLRNRLLLNAVNRVFVESGDFRRLEGPVSAGMSGSFGTGVWFTITESNSRTRGNTSPGDFSEGTRAYIFTFIGEGTFFPCAAIVKPGGDVEEFIPLNNHGARMIKQISPGILRIYAQRIGGDKS